MDPYRYIPEDVPDSWELVKKIIDSPNGFVVRSDCAMLAHLHLDTNGPLRTVIYPSYIFGELHPEMLTEDALTFVNKRREACGLLPIRKFRKR